MVTEKLHLSHRTQGNSLVLALFSIAVLMMVAATVLRTASNRVATVSQSNSWQQSYFLAESGIDIARHTLQQAATDPTVWSTVSYPDSSGNSYQWTPGDASTFPKTLNMVLPSVSDDLHLASRIRVQIDRPTGAGTMNPTGTAVTDYTYRVRSFGTVDLPGPLRASNDPTEVNLRKVSWFYDWRSGDKLMAQGNAARTTRSLEAVLHQTSPFVAVLVADDSIELKKGDGKITDSWNSNDPDSSQRKYIKPDSDKWKGAHDVGNIAANGLATKRPTKDIIRLEKTVVWGDAYLPDPKNLIIKPAPKLLTDVIKGGDILGGFYLKLDPVPTRGTMSLWGSPTGIYSVTPGTATTPLRLTASADPDNPARYKFTSLHVHDNDNIVVLPPVDASDKPIATSYVEIYVANSLRIHKGGQILLGNGVNAKIFVDKCIHIESTASQNAGIKYAKITLNGNGSVKRNTGNIVYTEVDAEDAQNTLLAKAEQLQIYGTLVKGKRSHGKISAELLGSIYAPRHDFNIKMKDSGYADLYGSFIGRKFKIEGKTRLHYDEALANTGIPNDFTIVSLVEDWYDRSGGK